MSTRFKGLTKIADAAIRLKYSQSLSSMEKKSYSWSDFKGDAWNGAKSTVQGVGNIFGVGDPRMVADTRKAAVRSIWGLGPLLRWTTGYDAREGYNNSALDNNKVLAAANAAGQIGSGAVMTAGLGSATSALVGSAGRALNAANAAKGVATGAANAANVAKGAANAANVAKGATNAANVAKGATNAANAAKGVATGATNAAKGTATVAENAGKVSFGQKLINASDEIKNVTANPFSYQTKFFANGVRNVTNPSLTAWQRAKAAGGLGLGLAGNYMTGKELVNGIKDGDIQKSLTSAANLWTPFGAGWTPDSIPYFTPGLAVPVQAADLSGATDYALDRLDYAGAGGSKGELARNLNMMNALDF